MTPQAFKVFYKEHSRKLFRICFVFTKDEAIASEMVQDIFCSLWERRSSLTIHGDIENFLYRCAKFQYFNYQRNQKVKARFHQEEFLLRNAITNHTEEAVIFGELEARIEMLVEGMPNRRKEVYKLSRQKGLSVREIANHLTISEKTVKNHLTHSLTYLRGHLREVGYSFSAVIGIIFLLFVTSG